MAMIQHGTKALTRVVDRFEAKDLGAPFKVILHDSVEVSFSETTGEVLSYKIPDLEGLLRAITISRILHPRKLFGADIKFLRKSVGLKQKELAGKIAATVEHLSRCETGALPMSPMMEKLFRVFILKTVLKLHKMKTCDAKSKLEDALDRLFDAVEPISAFDIYDELELNFHRTRPHVLGDGDDEPDDGGHWDGELEAA